MTDDEDLTMHRVQGNLYTHFGAPNGEELRLATLLSNEIDSALRERGWTPTAAAEATGLPEQDIRAMRNGNLQWFHVRHPLDALTKLGCNITIVVHPPDEESGVIHVQGIDD